MGWERVFDRNEPAAVITGFNTDIEYEGVVYHVQTEDKGLDSPIILSLVYSGGAILASKRSPYEDLIRQGFSDELLAERLKRQHRLICAAIHSGRLDDLRKMSARETQPIPAVQLEAAPVEEVSVEEVPVEEVAEQVPVEDEFELEIGDSLSQKYEPDAYIPSSTEKESEEEEEEEEEPEQVDEETLVPEPAPVGAYRISKQRGKKEPSPETPVQPPPPQPTLEQGLVVRLLDANEFYSGDSPNLRVLVTRRVGYDENPLGNANVSIKVLGTTFRPLIYSVKTQKDGIASLSTQIPQFTSGRAAVLIRAMVNEEAAEVRCVIHPNR